MCVQLLSNYKNLLINFGGIYMNNKKVTNASLNNEIWKVINIPEFANFYEISNNKNVRSVNRVITTYKGVARSQTGKQLKRNSTSVTLSKNNFRRSYSVNYLYTLAFEG